MMENKRQKENATVLNALGNMAEAGAIIDETTALVYIGTFLGDISKSLAIIADAIGGDSSCT